MAQPTTTRVRFVYRALQISGLVLKHALRWLVGWCLLRLRFAVVDRRRAWFGQVVLDLFRELGATFIKVGQIMSTRPDLVPEHISRALEKLQDDVGPFPFAAVVSSIEEDLGRPLSGLFAEFSPMPLASASVSQVHKARLPDGRLVAVKVRRPNVVELCAFDLGVMRIGARLLGVIPSLSLLRPEAAVEEFGRAIFAQLDFQIEARNNRRFQQNFAQIPGIIFPEVIEGLSSSRVLTMSFIEGTKILAIEGSRVDRKRLARVGLRALMKMIFEDGFVHADLHPGNILLTPDEKIALLDLGLVAELDGPHREAFAAFFAAWAQKDGRTMAELMYKMSASGEKSEASLERYQGAVVDFVERYWGQRLGQVQVGKVLFDVLGILRRHRVRVNPTFTVVNIAIAVTEGIGKQLDPELDLMEEALPFFLERSMRAAERSSAP